MIIKREFQFDAAHMLSQYTGKCANLHGHTYTGEVEICADVKDDGMVVDFNVIKDIIDMYDHAIIFSHKSIREEKEDALYQWANQYKMKNVVMGYGKCTAENIADEIAYYMSQASKQCRWAKCVLHETPNSTVVGEWISPYE